MNKIYGTFFCTFGWGTAALNQSLKNSLEVCENIGKKMFSFMEGIPRFHDRLKSIPGAVL